MADPHPGATPMTITSEEARAREVLAATPHLTGCLRYRGVPGGCTCDNDRAVRAMLAFAHQSPSRAAGEGFLDAVREFGPNGEFVVVQVWPNGDWSVYDPASENAPKVVEPATPQTVPANAELSGREYLLLASYCGDDNDACTDQRPCDDCLAMCNVFRVADAEPTFAREFGRLLSAPR